MRVDQDMAMRVYSQPAQTTSAAAVPAAAQQTADAAAGAAKQPDTTGLSSVQTRKPRQR